MLSSMYLMAKTDPQNETKWLPLVIHSQDTCGVIQYLVRHWLPRGVNLALGLSQQELINIAVFLALVHDIGKATPGFQNKVIIGYPEIASVLEENGLSPQLPGINNSAAPHAKAGAELLRNAGCPERVAQIVGAHHGKPEGYMHNNLRNYDEFRSLYVGIDNPQAWHAVQDALIQNALKQAGYRSMDELPELSLGAQVLLTGLLIMADWIASNTRYFPLVYTEDIPMLHQEQRLKAALSRLDLPSPWLISDDWAQSGFFSERFGFKANNIQTAVLETAAGMDKPGLMILEAPMGVGKTEAALAAAEAFMNRFQLGGIAFFLPSQATGNAMFSRLLAWAEAQPDAERVTVSLAHAMAAMNDAFASLADGTVSTDADEPNLHERLTVHTFFRGRKTALLADLVVGTVDQLLMAGLMQKHVMLRHLGLAGKVVIVDEVHSYDAYMHTYLDMVLGWLGAYSVPVILLSATLPGARRDELLSAYCSSSGIKQKPLLPCRDYPLLTWTDGQTISTRKIQLSEAPRTVRVMPIAEDALPPYIKCALEAGGCAGIIVNTVKRARALAEQFLQMLPNAEIFVDHSQFLVLDRIARDECICLRVGKHSTADTRAGVLVIGTQVLEQSLDLDFDLLATDLCPMDLLLQRIGRLFRHNRPRPTALSQATCLVLCADTPTLESGAKHIYGEYLLLRTRAALPQYITLPDDISPLVQTVYEGELPQLEHDEMYLKVKEAFMTAQSTKRNKAKGYLLPAYEDDGFEDSFPTLLSYDLRLNDVKARATVRDGVSSIEVLMLMKDADGNAVLLSGASKGMRVPMNATPDQQTARDIAMQRIRLPSRFCTPWAIDNTLAALTEITSRYLRQWLYAPLLDGELFMLLDEQHKAELSGVKLTYDEKTGLYYE